MPGPEAEKLLSLVTMIFAIAPAIAPILGGWVVETFDWRTIFLVPVRLLVRCCSGRAWHVHLPETLPPAQRQPFNADVAVAQLQDRCSSTLRFHAYAGTVAFNFVGLFIYVAAAPVFIIEHLHLTQREFGWFFIPSVAGIFLGALLANRLRRTQWKIGKQVRDRLLP